MIETDLSQCVTVQRCGLSVFEFDWNSFN